MSNNEVLDGTLVANGGVSLGASAVMVGNASTTTSTNGATTLNANRGIITTEVVSNAVQATYTLTITNSAISSTDLIFATVQNGTNTGGPPLLASAKPGAGVLTISIFNGGVSAGVGAFNGTLKVSFMRMQ